MIMSPCQKLKLVDKLLDSVVARKQQPTIFSPELFQDDYVKSNKKYYYHQQRLMPGEYRRVFKK